jgi:hypothetical protein
MMQNDLGQNNWVDWPFGLIGFIEFIGLKAKWAK